MGFFIFLVIVVALGAAYVFRVPLIAKLTGQPRSRIDRQLNKRRK